MMRILLQLSWLVLAIGFLTAQDNELYLSHKSLSSQERLIYNAEFELERSCDPATGLIPPNIHKEEIDFIKNIPVYGTSNNMKKLGGKNSIQQTGINFNWQQRGPWNTGGRFLCLAFDTDNENIINAGAASGGMWRTIDKGKSWVKTSDLLTVQSIYCLTQDKRKNKHNIWYYGTGEMLSTTDRSVSTRVRTMNTGGGIWKSVDNGASWEPLKSTLGGDPAYPDNPFQGVWNIVIDSKTSFATILYAACYGGIYRSENGGDTWNLVLGDKDEPPFSSYIIQNKMGVFYAAIASMTLSGNKPSTYGIFRSTDGENWQEISPIDFPDTTRTIKLAVSESNPNIVYVIAERPSSGLDPYYFGSSWFDHFFWKYTDVIGGKGVWEYRSDFLPNGSNKIERLNTLGSYAMTLIVKPDDENTVILGGTNVYVSTDGFSSQDNTSHIGGYYPKGGYDLDNLYCHPDIHGFAIPPSNSKALYVANDGGLHKTDDFTVAEPDWTPLNNGIFATQFYTVSVDPTQTNDSFVFGGLQDNSSQYTFSPDNKKNWVAVIGGDGMASVVAADKKFVIGSWYNGGTVSFTFDKDSVPTQFFYQRPNFLNSGNFTFYTLFNLDKNDNNTFYLPAKKDLWRKTNMLQAVNDDNYLDSNWTKIATTDHNDYITALNISVKPADIVVFGSNIGKVYKITNSKSEKPQKVEITSDIFPKNAYCSGIDIDPKNADNIMVAFSNYHVKSIFYSNDGGNNFIDVSYNLEQSQDGTGAGPGVRRVKKIYTPDGESFYLAATTAGLFINRGPFGDNEVATKWERVGADKFGNVIIDWIDAPLTGGSVAIATHGAGVWTAAFNITGINDNFAFNNFYLNECYPNPAHNNTRISFSLDKTTNITLNLFDAEGRIIDIIAKGVYSAGITAMNYDVSNLASGVYFIHLSANNKSLTKKIIVVQ